jgi:hypothetical protein
MKTLSVAGSQLSEEQREKPQTTDNRQREESY